jgi:iron complex outermembrane receptor protein
MNRRIGPARRALMTGAALTALLSGAGHVMAQTVSATAAPEGGAVTLNEVVVTAQKREQRLQDVPVAVTAISQETLKSNRVLSVMNLTGLAPGLVTRINPGSLGSPSISLRGVFASASIPSQDRQISSYLDGVYIGGVRGSVFDLPDIERIEVLRGPQGTLFGRNSTAGAIQIITRNPTGKFHLRQELTGGNEDQFRSRTSVDFPAIGPFSAYVTYLHDYIRGDVRNLGAGVVFDRTSPFSPNLGASASPAWLGGHNKNDVFLAAKFQPSSNFSMVYKFDWEHEKNTPKATGSSVINPKSFVGGMLLGVIAAQPPGGGRFGPYVQPGTQRPDAINNGWNQTGYSRAQGHSLTIQWHALDNLTFKNITSYRYATVWGPSTILGLNGLEFNQGAVAPYAFFATLAGGLPLAALPLVAASLQPKVGQFFAGYEGASWGSSWQESNETQVFYTNKWMNLTAGGLWYHAEEVDSGLPGFTPNNAFGPVPSLLPLGNIQIWAATTTSYALYAQGEFHLTPQLDLVAGGRFTKDEKKGELTQGGIFVGSRTSGMIVSGTGAPGSPTLTFFPWSFSKSRPTFSVGLNYKVSPDMLVYGKYSTGFLSGGAQGPLSFKPETVASWEGGVKSEWFDRRLRANLAIWQAIYHNSQSAQAGTNAGFPNIGVVVVSNGKLSAKGAEFEISAEPVRGLTLNGSVSYTSGKLDNPSPLVAQGHPYLWAADPPWQGNLNGEYDTPPLFQDAYLSARIDAIVTGKFRAIATPLSVAAQPLFAPYEFEPTTWIINGRVALRDIKTGPVTTEVALWVKNLADNKNTDYGFDFGEIGFATSWQHARTFGIDVKMEY